MSYDFKTCFWDPNDEGVNILLSHINDGIKSIHTLEQFFKNKSELEKDYSRRMSAINEKFGKDLSNNNEFGKLNDSLNNLLLIQKAISQGHAKQSEIISAKVYSDLKLFSQEVQARYTTLSGKIENLRMDKFNKKRGCEELLRKLKEAEAKARDLKLNQNNIIGSRKVEHNNKELLKWESNANEIAMQLNVLKKEYKASQKFWLKEWGHITTELQEMESNRISFIQSKLQQFSDISMETSILEQTKFDFITNDLVGITPMDDISKFSSEYGTGRLKEKHQKNFLSDNSNNYTSDDRRFSQVYLASTNNKYSHDPSSSHSSRDSYMDNIRKLSNQLQNSHLSRQQQAPPASLTESRTAYMHSPREESQRRMPSRGSNRMSSMHRYSLHESQLPSYNHHYDHDDRSSRIERKLSHSRMQSFNSKSDLTPSNPDDTDIVHRYNDIIKSSPKENIQNDSKRKKNSLHEHTESHTSSSSTGSSSSNPTDFTTHLNRRPSNDSMSTSVTSMASSIDDNQRFAKSWNSTNRKRKSMSHIASALESANTTMDRLEDNNKNSSPVRQSSTNTILMKSIDSNSSSMLKPVSRNSNGHSRRKSMVLENSKNPIEDAIYEMDRLQSGIANDATVGRVKDNGIIVTLPIVTRSGKHVIKYAKALYPLLDNNAPEVAHFDKNDYLLITEEISNDWYLGEVYDNDRIDPAHRIGLIPCNFIQTLE